MKLEDLSLKARCLSYSGEDYKIGVVSLPTFYFDFEAAARGEENFDTRDVRDLLEELSLRKSMPWLWI